MWLETRIVKNKLPNCKFKSQNLTLSISLYVNHQNNVFWYMLKFQWSKVEGGTFTIVNREIFFFSTGTLRKGLEKLKISFTSKSYKTKYDQIKY